MAFSTFFMTAFFNLTSNSELHTGCRLSHVAANIVLLVLNYKKQDRSKPSKLVLMGQLGPKDVVTAAAPGAQCNFFVMEPRIPADMTDPVHSDKRYFELPTFLVRPKLFIYVLNTQYFKCISAYAKSQN